MIYLLDCLRRKRTLYRGPLNRLQNRRAVLKLVLVRKFTSPSSLNLFHFLTKAGNFSLPPMCSDQRCGPPSLIRKGNGSLDDYHCIILHGFTIQTEIYEEKLTLCSPHNILFYTGIGFHKELSFWAP
jgi:hypothetical protein